MRQLKLKHDAHAVHAADTADAISFYRRRCRALAESRPSHDVTDAADAKSVYITDQPHAADASFVYRRRYRPSHRSH